MPRSVVTLPSSEQEVLKRHYGDRDLPALRTRVYALRQAKWPLRAIGEPLGAPRSTVLMWQKGYNEESDAALPDVPECPRAARQRGEKVVRRRIDVPRAERDQLRDLAGSARLVRSGTPKDAQIRKDADKLDGLIDQYIARKIPVKRIADHMGVTPRAVTARHERSADRKDVDA